MFILNFLALNGYKLVLELYANLKIRSELQFSQTVRR